MQKGMVLFKEYPDVVDINQLCEMLGGIGVKTAYSLLHGGEIKYLKIGRSFRIPKVNVIDYIMQTQI